MVRKEKMEVNEIGAGKEQKGAVVTGMNR